jgi:hypothetical protein
VTIPVPHVLDENLMHTSPNDQPAPALDPADRYHAARAHKAQAVGAMFAALAAAGLAAARRVFARTIRASPCPPPRSRAAR